MHLEGTWSVFRNDREVGQCRFQRQGLYWLVEGQCTGQGGLVCRLWLVSGELTFNLGIPVPEGDGLSLRRRIAMKGLCVPGDFRLVLKPLDESGAPSREDTPPSHTSPEPEATEEATAVSPALEEEPPAGQEVAPEESPSAQQPELVTTEEATEATTEETTDIPAEKITDTPADETTDSSAEETADKEDALETTAAKTATDEVPTTESATEPILPAPTEPFPKEENQSTPRGIPYDPQKPLPPLGNWESLRAVSDGHGGLLICTSGEDKVL